MDEAGLHKNETTAIVKEINNKVDIKKKGKNNKANTIDAYESRQKSQLNLFLLSSIAITRRKMPFNTDELLLSMKLSSDFAVENDDLVRYIAQLSDEKLVKYVRGLPIEKDVAKMQASFFLRNMGACPANEKNVYERGKMIIETIFPSSPGI